MTTEWVELQTSPQSTIAMASRIWLPRVGMLAAIGTLVFLSGLFAAGRASITPQFNMINAEGGLDEASASSPTGLHKSMSTM